MCNVNKDRLFIWCAINITQHPSIIGNALFTCRKLLFLFCLIKFGSKREGWPECIRRPYCDLFPGAGVGCILVSAAVHFELKHARARPRGLTRSSHHCGVAQSRFDRREVSSDQTASGFRRGWKRSALFKRFSRRPITSRIGRQRTSCVDCIGGIGTRFSFRSIQRGAAPTRKYVIHGQWTSH